MKYYKFKPEGNRKCEVKVFADQNIYNQIEETALKQLFNAAKLPGITGVVGLPDIHQGYGLPIGGVMASNLDNGIVSPGAVGFDINCGVRLLTSKLDHSEVKNQLDNLIEKIKRTIPAGLGKNSKFNFNNSEFKKIVERGIPFTVNELGLGLPQDIYNTEEKGQIKNADLNQVSNKAIKRGKTQLGTLGSGNHFIEIQSVEKIFSDSQTQLRENQILFMIHTGSRGFGHQIAQNYINLAKENNYKYDFDLPSKNLASFPINSTEANNYLQAMACGANFAFANRQIITYQLREILSDFFQTERNQFQQYYGLAHNIVKQEKHQINNQEETLLVHRKGATKLTNKTALIPGSMGTNSYIVKPKEKQTIRNSFASVAHGAGRKMSRRAAKQNINHCDHLTSLGKVKCVCSSNNNLLDESPLAYKDINQVIAALTKTGLAQPIAKLKPLAVLKG
ncbi:RtcB family protein [Sporohalobacter salinus]|uniref:RtcB family protein n=1 Tax=Sporohalobacter salinus TaxID=1494606 RepID=UPI00196210FD|nr:RtcB family protein [Sporohalobacter salinus]MBM7623585.1 tRNA-splicing ligase RtcB [Sporohalobacter salinus]